MAFIRPTLSELSERIKLDFVSRLNLTAPILRRSMVAVLSRVIAGAAHMLHGHIEFLSRQIFPDLSDGDYLLRQAALFGLFPKAAEYAAGPVNVTGTAATVPAGTILVRSDGTRYEVDADIAVVSGTATGTATAVDPGAAGNSDEGTILSFESPIAGVDSTALAGTGGLVNGSDEEDLESLRDRLLDRLREPPHGGAAADYIAWAKEVPGVTRAWVYPLELGAGTVVVRFVRDDDASIIPDAGEVAAVQAHIDEVRPVTATVTVQAPTAVPLNYTIHITPDTTATRASVAAELQDLLRRVAKPGGTILKSAVEVAVGTAEGVTDFEVTVPVGDVGHSTGQMAEHGTITWI